MSKCRWIAWVVLAGLLAGLEGRADELPSDAAKQIKQFQTDAEAAQRKADKDIKERLDKLIAGLQALQNDYAKQNKLDEAVAIRSAIRQLQATPVERLRTSAGAGLLAEPAGQGVPARPPAAARQVPPAIVATEARAPKPVKVDKLPEFELPTSTAPRQSIRGVQTQDKGLRITVLNLKAEEIVGDLVWTPKGDAFFALTSNGVLSRIAAKDFSEQKRLDMGRRCSFLALSAEGLLAAMADLQEVWVIDAMSLTVKRRIAAPAIQRVLSGPGLKFALSAGGLGPADREGGVIYLDLVKGVPIHQFQAHTQHARITPDGKFYFAQSGIEQLCSYRIEGQSLIADQTSERIAQNGQGICVSPDSKYVCLPSGGGNYGATYGTYVYAVGNLSKPEITLNSGAYPRLVGFDPAGKLVYAQNAGSQLIVFSTTAIKLAEHSLTGGRGNSDDPRQFVSHPEGRKFLALLSKTLLFVELIGP